ncbi:MULTISPECIES: hypothetical protein [Rhodococcus]|uniref:hypothetical protein n=1 Tax=Rhodococcus TaxID=1827 RepID=UPI0013ED309E|nr:MULTISPECIES: hypothetical protein [Rhodococcus]UTT51146.1 hypothetical protein NMQ04_21760 [Rhodococcus gordoniae]
MCTHDRWSPAASTDEPENCASVDLFERRFTPDHGEILYCTPENCGPVWGGMTISAS